MITVTSVDSFFCVSVNAGLILQSWQSDQLKQVNATRVNAMRHARMVVLTSRYYALPAITRKHRDRHITAISAYRKNLPTVRLKIIMANPWPVIKVD